MKKLALASVAFAGISAFGAGDSFATGAITVYTSQSSFMTAVSVTDSLNWTQLQSPAGSSSTVVTASAPGGVAAFTAYSDNGLKMNGAYTYPSGTGSVSVFFQSSGVQSGFIANTDVLLTNGSGALTLSFTKALVDVGFFVSPASGFGGSTGEHFIATVGASLSAVPVGSTGVNGTIVTGCSAASCTFVGLADPAGFNKLTISIANSDGGAPYPVGIGNLELDQSQIPEPASLSVLGIGLVGLGALRRRRRSVSDSGGARGDPFGRWRATKGSPEQTSL